MTNTIKISEKDKVFQIATVAGWDNPTYAEFSIKYCPMCGRILEENE
ncbi:TPA: hypothetical protein LWO37_000615 [Listeria monocytogenes]|nr:hypothetical protein [Listeria monocytogenes]